MRRSRGARGEASRVVLAVLAGMVLGGVVAALGPVGGAPPASQVEVAGAVVDRDVRVGATARSAAERGVLRVDAVGCGERRQASLTVLDTPDGPVPVTNAHVVRGSGTVTVSDGAATFELVVRGAVAGRDLAVLEAPGGPGPLSAAALVPAPTAPPGTPVLVAGFPDGVERATVATVRSVEARSARGATSDVLVVDAQVRGGSSGGAVLDAEGRVVGVVAARDPSTGHAVAHPVRDALTRGLDAVPGC